MAETNEIAVAQQTMLTAVEQEEKAFALVQRQAKMFASSTLIPKAYQGNMGNIIIALNISKKVNADPLMVMQNLDVIQGKPSWSSKFLIATINSCGRYSSLRYEFKGEEGKASRACRAYCYERSDKDHKEPLYGAWVSMEMAQQEGWLGKPGSKWKTMPEQMLRYRAATFWQRTNAPELGLGLLTQEEARDISVDPEDVPFEEIKPEEDPDSPQAKVAQAMAEQN